MELTKITADVENITNQPNLIVGKASELKKTFDKGNKDIKEYINKVLIPELEAELQLLYSSIAEQIAKIVNSAPETLDTIDELANALGDDPNFATTVFNLIGKKLETAVFEAYKTEMEGKLENIEIDLPLEKGSAENSLQSKPFLGNDSEEASECSADGLAAVSTGLGTQAPGKAGFSSGKRTSASAPYSAAFNNRGSALGNRSFITGQSGISAVLDCGLTPESTVEEVIAAWLANNKNFAAAIGNNSFVGGANCLTAAYSAIATGEYTLSLGSCGYTGGLRTASLGLCTFSHAFSAISVLDALPNLNSSTPKEEIFEAWLKTPFALALNRAAVNFGVNNLSLGGNAFTIGQLCAAIANNSFAGGASSIVREGAYEALAFGWGAIAHYATQVVLGKFNIEDVDDLYQFIIGIGFNANERRNGFTVDRNGEAWALKGFTIGEDKKSVATEKYVDDKLDNIVLKSPNGTKFKLTVADDGSLVTEAVA